MKKETPESLYYKAPSDLKDKLYRLSQEKKTEPKSFFSWNRSKYLVLIASSIVLFFVSRITVSPSMEKILIQEIVSSHIRSMMASNHLIDVASTDRHTVKPWFNGKIDFSPKVIDLSAERFIMIGGRLDYIESRPIAAVVYRRDQHIINFLTWPINESASQEITFSARQGYSLFHWISGGMEYWVISDLNANDLRTFAELMHQKM
jgi:anti-sigma factor RsiW